MSNLYSTEVSSLSLPILPSQLLTLQPLARNNGQGHCRDHPRRNRSESIPRGQHRPSTNTFLKPHSDRIMVQGSTESMPQLFGTRHGR